MWTSPYGIDKQPALKRTLYGCKPPLRLPDLLLAARTGPDRSGLAEANGLWRQLWLAQVARRGVIAATMPVDATRRVTTRRWRVDRWVIDCVWTKSRVKLVTGQ